VTGEAGPGAASPDPPRLGLFEGYGIELEYMIVDRETLDVRPLCDQVLHDATGGWESEHDDADGVTWSNELALHVVELKTSGPAPRLEGVARRFQASVGRMDRLLAAHGAGLLPGAMHPWMDPSRELRLWPHGDREFYQAFDRIFDCRGHGWANLQSVHLNLPFAEDGREDGEFARLHLAIRAILPLLPAVAASSPFCEGRATGLADTRLDVYRSNCARVPSVTANVVPEPIRTRQEYERTVLERIYRDMAPLDPEGVLRHEWCNARGAIARFDRGAIEIRVLDVQEQPAADVAIAALVAAVVRGLVEERWAPLATQAALPQDALVAQLAACVKDAEEAPILDRGLRACLGPAAAATRAGDAWRRLSAEVWPAGSPAARAFGPALEPILREGTLSTRLRRAAGAAPGRSRLEKVHAALADCLRSGRSFLGA